MSIERLQQSNLVKRLKFELDDFESLASSYTKWIEKGDSQTQHQLQLWAYCYIRRYLLQQFLRYGLKDSEAFESLLEKTFLRCWNKFGAIRNPMSVAGWVLSVSRNSLKNFLRDVKGSKLVELQPGDELLDEIKEELDLPVILDAIKKAIMLLPQHLKKIANLRFVYNMPYDEICNTTGLEIQTVRAYCHKITNALRSDSRLSELREDFLNERQ